MGVEGFIGGEGGGGGRVGGGGGEGEGEGSGWEDRIGGVSGGA